MPEAIAVVLLNTHAISHTQLFQCASEALGDALLKIDAAITCQPVDVLMASMKVLVVIHVATGVIRSELLDLKQKRDEPYRSFSARVLGKAETCGFTTKSMCLCGQLNKVDYTDHIIRYVLIS